MFSREIVHLGGPAPGSTGGEDAAPSGGAAETLWSLLDDRLRGRWGRAAIIGAAVGLALGGAGYLCSSPMYESTGIIRVAPVVSPVLRDTPETGMLPLYDYFVETQMRLIESRAVMEQALKDPTVAAAPWAEDPRALQRLKRDLNIEASRGSELITVKYVADSPEFAQAAVNAVMRAYDGLYVSSDRNQIDHKVATLKQRRDELQALRAQKLEEIQGFVDASQYGAPDFEVLISARTTQLGALEQSIDKLEQMLDAISAAEPTGAAVAGGDQGPSLQELAAHDSELSHLLEVRGQLVLNLEVARQRWRSGHPQVVRIERDIDGVKETIRQREAALRAERAITGPLVGGTAQEPPRSREQIQAELEATKRMAERARDQLREISSDETKLDEMRAAIRDYERELTELDDRINNLDMEKDAARTGRITVVTYGDQPLFPTRDPRKKLAAVGLAGGFAMSFGAFFLLGTVDRRTYAARQLRAPGGARCLGVLPHLGDGQLGPEASGIAAHCAHQIRNRIEAARDSKASLVLAVTSPAQGDGKTSVSIALGWSYAAAGERTLLVDCDMVGTSLTRQMGVANTGGLSECLRTGELNGQAVPLSVPNLSVLPAGTRGGIGAETVRKDELAALLDQLRRAYDVILVDTGPMPGSLESLPVAATADGVVVVFRRGRQRARLDDCLDFLASAGAECLGVVLNGAARSDINLYASASAVSRPAALNGAAGNRKPVKGAATGAGAGPNVLMQAMKAASVRPEEEDS